MHHGHNFMEAIVEKYGVGVVNLAYPNFWFIWNVSILELAKGVRMIEVGLYRTFARGLGKFIHNIGNISFL